MKKPISLEDAREIFRKFSAPVGVDEVPIADSLERVLAENIVADFPVPPFRKSPLDGYAMRASDTSEAGTEAPVCLRVIETVYAGEVPSMPVISGEATAVTTGAPLPEGSDAVIKYEDIRREGDGIFISSPLHAGENIILQGEDVKSGETILTRGTAVTPAAAGLLASLGKRTVFVHRKPRVAVFSIGDELMEVDRPLGPGKIYNSNLFTLCAQIREAGGIAVPGRTIPDDTDAIARALNEALAENDMIITSGGASVGDKDLIRTAIVTCGGNGLFWRVSMKPGTAIACGEKRGKLIIGLSGNPSAAMVSFLLLVRPILRGMSGHGAGSLPEVSAVMEMPFRKQSSQRRFLLATVSLKNGAYHAVPSGIQSPGAVKSMLRCNALVDIPPDHGPLREGETVKALLLPPLYSPAGNWI
jgi:molybdopterin molybdotransferase